MKCDAGRGKLYDALQQINNRWNEIDPLWNDPARLEFEEKIWQPLNALSEEALRAIDRLIQVFAQMRRECEGTLGFGDLS